MSTPGGEFYVPPPKIVVVGQAPNSTNLPPFSGRSGERLSELAGRPLHEWAELRNILPKWPGRHESGVGDAWPASAARKSATLLRKELRDRKQDFTVLLLGRQVADAFNVPRKTPWFSEANVWGLRIIVAPHPSGISRWWNDPKNVEQFRDFLRRTLDGKREG